VSLPELTATVCSGIFAGAATYITLVQHPAARSLGTRFAVELFRPMYARAAPMQASLALLGSAAASSRSLARHRADERSPEGSRPRSRVGGGR
jgi:hypothetical protein